MSLTRRDFLKLGGLAAFAGGVSSLGRAEERVAPMPQGESAADYTIRIGTGLIELAPDRIISTTTYNGQFPGPTTALQRRAESPSRHLQRYRYAGAAALARPVPVRRRRWF